jgi:hypothetical protein
MVIKLLRAAGTGGGSFRVASLGAICLCITLWIRAKTVDQEERDNAERRALFVGLWPPMLWLMGDTVAASERVERRRWSRRVRGFVSRR